MNPYREAFREPANLIGIGGLVAVSAAMMNPLPLLAGIVAEAAYILFLPETQWYRARLKNKASTPTADNEAQERLQAVQKLPPALQARYRRLETIRGEIEQKLRAQVSFTPEILPKLDRLLGQFIAFSTSQVQFVTYLQSLLAEQSGGARPPAPPQRYVPTYPPRRDDVRLSPLAGNPIDLNQLGRGDSSSDGWAQWAVGRIQTRFNAELNKLDPEAESDPSLKELKQKRVDVLSRRNEYVGKLGKALSNLILQLQLIEDTFGLINDEVSTQNPDRVVGEIDNLMAQTDTLTKTLQEVDDLYGSRVAA